MAAGTNDRTHFSRRIVEVMCFIGSVTISGDFILSGYSDAGNIAAYSVRHVGYVGLLEWLGLP